MAIGVTSFGHRRKDFSTQYKVAEVFSRITIDVKKWIKGIATGAQDSNCKGSDGVETLC